MMNKLLMIAYHFPPIRVSSGIQRTLKFATYLLNHQWQAQVLTVHPRAYEKVSDDQLHEIPLEVEVKRAFALDTARHLSIKGRYVGWWALPDRWVTWCLGGVWGGLKLIRRHRPRLIWSTYPIATAHLLGLLLHRLTGLPWIADFRDSMTEEGYPANPVQWKVYRWIERETVNRCIRAIFTTPGAIRMYAERYPEIPSSRWVLIPNGYDEENFLRAEQSDRYLQLKGEKNPNQIVLLHSGVLYPSERDPSQFFAALAALKQRGGIWPEQFKVILRATGHDALHLQAIQAHDLTDIVFLEPGIAYEEALAEMLTVDGLLIFQAANCNHQIPAKIYEYFRTRRPILALTDPLGDTAQVMREAGLDTIVPLDDQVAIEQALLNFIHAIQAGKVSVPNEAVVASHSRQSRTALLAEVFNEVCS